MKPILFPVVCLAIIFCRCTGNWADKTSDEDINITGTTLRHVRPGNRPVELLCQAWQDSTDVADGILAGSGSSGMEIPFHGFYFFNNGIVVQNPRDYMKIGKWHYDTLTKHIILVFKDAATADYKVKSLDVHRLELQAGNGEVAVYKSDGLQRTDVNDEPFYPANNIWRIKPASAETNTEIKNRVVSCLLFYHKFLQDNTDRHAKMISFYGLPSCFKWYAGGISIINKDKLSQKWKDCFYSPEQAIKAQQLLENNISKKYKWDKAEQNWVKQSAGILLQIADSIRISH